MASGLSVYLSEIRSGGLENTFVVFVRTPLLYVCSSTDGAPDPTNSSG
jgi:hypothetical protein